MISILFFAAEPTDMVRLRLGEEIREIQEKIQMSKFRNNFSLSQRFSVRPIDISQALLDLNPLIVHFSGHGTKSGAICLENEVGEMKPVHPAVLAALFEQFSNKIHCVILNACYSEIQARSISEHIDYVIGMNKAIGDRAAIAFSSGFYQALGAGRSIEESYKLGCVQLGLQEISEYSTPVLIKKQTASFNLTSVQQQHFVVDWPRLKTFKGREAQFYDLHDKLKKEHGRAGIRAAGFSGLGGVGKTQLAVEYVYRYRNDYPGGVYWINGAADWTREISNVAERIGLVPVDPMALDRDRQMVASFYNYLRSIDEDALLVLDNIENPIEVEKREIGPKLRMLDLNCKLLITTRCRNLPDDFATLAVDVLPLEDARNVLLESRPDALNDPVIDDICTKLGCLPLALGLAAAALRKRSMLSPQAFFHYLEKIGIDEIVQRVKLERNDLSLPDYANFAVEAALGWHWKHIGNRIARLLLTLGSAYGEAAIIPLARLHLLTSLTIDQNSLEQPFEDALHELLDFNLVEPIGVNSIRLHPLVRIFVRKRAPNYSKLLYKGSCLLVESYRRPDIIQSQTIVRGFLAVLDDLRETRLALQRTNDLLDKLEYIFSVEAYHLRDWKSSSHQNEAYLIQHIRERAHHEGDDSLRSLCDMWLAKYPHFCTEDVWRFPIEGELRRLQTGHRGSIRSIVYLGDGKHILSSSEDKTVRMWNLNTGEMVRLFEGHTAGVRGMAVLPGEKQILSTSADKTIRLWDLNTAKTVQVFEGHSAGVCGVVVLPNKRILSASEDGTLRLWNMETGKTESVFTGHTDRINTVIILNDGKQALSASYDKTLRLWDIEAGKTLRIFEGHTDRVRDVVLVNGGQLALSSSYDKTMRLWDIETGETVRVLSGHTDWVMSVGILDDGIHALSASYDKTVRVWDLTSGKQVDVWEHNTGVLSVTVVGNDQIISGAWDGSLRLWDLHTRQMLCIIEGQTDFVRNVCVIRNGEHALSASDNEMVQLWDLHTGKIIKTFQHKGVRHVIALKNRQQVLTASEDKTLRLLDIDTGNIIWTMEGHAAAVWGIALMSDNQVLSASFDGTLRQWDLDARNLMHVFEGHKDWVWGIETTKDGNFALSFSADKTLRFWDLSARKTIYVLTGHKERIRNATITCNDKLALSASDDKKVYAWSLTEGKAKFVLEGHTDLIWGVTALQEGKYALTVSDDYTLRLWDLSIKQALAVLRLTDVPTCMDLVADNRVLVGDRSGKLRVIYVCIPEETNV